MEQENNTIAYRKLIAWQKADELAFQIYQITKSFPREENFGLVSQMRRAALSVAANIAEGYTRRSKKDKGHFYNIAQGSLTEVEYYLDFALRLGYVPENRYQELIALRSETGRMLLGLVRNTSAKWITPLLLFLVPGLLFLVASSASAATMNFSPSSGSYAAGSQFNVNVYVSSADQAMNAASGVVSFPADKLEVASLSKSGSIFSFWVQDPTFSNTRGTLNFEGIVTNPGYTGSSGKLLSITFKAKAAGQAAVSFSSGSVLANDGKGTNILSSLGSATFFLGGAAPATSSGGATTPSTPGTPAAPVITSSTHPDSAKWYADSTADFSWNVPSDVTADQILVGKTPNATPTVIYSPPLVSKELTNVDDGVWYFHVRLKNSAGWGAIAHFRFQVDTQKPDRFAITERPRGDQTNPKAQFLFDGHDATSGIDHYLVQIDSTEAQTWKDDGTHVYQTPAVDPGTHTLIAQAVDAAGNTLADSAQFVVAPLETPIITDWPRELQAGDQFVVKGTTKYPNAGLDVFVQKQGEEVQSQSTKADASGKFTFVGAEKPTEGAYTYWLQAIDSRGAKSLPTGKLTFVVQAPAFLQIGSRAVNVLAVIVPIVALIFLLAYIALTGWQRLLLLRKRLRKEVREAEASLHKAMDVLKEDIRAQIKLLEKAKTKRQLTKEEEKIIERFKKDLDEAEEFVKKEIQDIEREVK